MEASCEVEPMKIWSTIYVFKHESFLQIKNAEDPFTAIQWTVKKSALSQVFTLKRCLCIPSGLSHQQCRSNLFIDSTSSGHLVRFSLCASKEESGLTWRSGNRTKDSCRLCLRVVWNHEPNRDVSGDMSYLLELCVHGGNALPWVHFIHPTFQTRPMLFAVVFYCSWLSFFAVWVFHQGLFYWLNMHLYFPPPILVNFV